MSEQLTPPQETALQAVLEGETYTNAALRARVARETVSRWANNDTPWSRERQRRSDALWTEYQNRQLVLLELAIGAHEWLLRNADYLGEHYDPRTHLRAVELAYQLSGMLPGRGPAVAVQINNAAESRDG